MDMNTWMICGIVLIVLGVVFGIVMQIVVHVMKKALMR